MDVTHLQRNGTEKRRGNKADTERNITRNLKAACSFLKILSFFVNVQMCKCLDGLLAWNRK